MPQVAEYLLFVESIFRFHTTQHFKHMLSPLATFLQVKAEGSSLEVTETQSGVENRK